MTSAVNCPKCGAQDARYLNVVHEAGLSSVDTQTRGGGCSPMSFLLFPFIGFWSLLFSSFGKSRTSGTVQSAVSARAEPPTRKPLPHRRRAAAAEPCPDPRCPGRTQS